MQWFIQVYPDNSTTFLIVVGVMVTIMIAEQTLDGKVVAIFSR